MDPVAFARYECHALNHCAFATLAADLTCFKRLTEPTTCDVVQGGCRLMTDAALHAPD
ncbi:hypothetical protein GCM10009660_05310 [Catellatospora bangladeshensis]